MKSTEITEASHGESSPFRESFKTESFFAGVGRLNLLDRIRRDVSEPIPLIVLTGEEGAGKSVVGRMLVAEDIADCQIVYFKNTIESFEDVVRVVAEKLGVEVVNDSRVGISTAMDAIARSVEQHGGRLLFICDAAEKIYLATLERIRKMLDRLNENGIFMQVVFIGRPSLLENLKQLSICNFEDVLENRYVLQPISLSETASYLDGCLKKLSEEDRSVFTPEVVDRIFQASSGNIKRINCLAEEVRNRFSQDASFRVLHEHVEGDKGRSCRITANTWLATLLAKKRSPIKLLITGAVLACGFFFLFFATGKNEGEATSVFVQESTQTLSQKSSSEAAVVEDIARQRIEAEEKAKDEGIIAVENPEVNEDSSAILPEQTVETGTETVAPDGDSEIAGGVKTDISVAADEVMVGLDTDKKSVLKIVGNLVSEVEPVSVNYEQAFQEGDKVVTGAGLNGTTEIEQENVYDSTLEEEKANASIAVEAVSDVAGVVLEPVSAEKVVIPLLSPGITKQRVSSEAEGKEESGEVENSNIVISSLARTDGRDIPVIRGGEEKKIVADVVDAQVRPMTQMAKPGVNAQAKDSLVKTSAQPEIVELKPKLPVKIGEPTTAELAPAELGIKKSPVVGAAIVPEGMVSAVSELFSRRVLAGASWLSGKSNEKYTLQLMALSSDTAEENINQILAQDKYSKEAGQFYIFEKDSKPPTIFVFLGEYASLTEARKARNSIPEFLKKHNPYVLSVQGAMQKVK